MAAPVVNSANHGALNHALKYKYGPALPNLVRKGSAFLDMMEESNDFEQTFGGRALLWVGDVSRGDNFGYRDEEGYFPGFSGKDNDDIDRPDVLEFTLPRAYMFGTAAFSSQWMNKVHTEFQQKKGYGFAQHLKYMQEDFKRHTQYALLGDGNGILGVVSSVGSFDSANNWTPVTMLPASTINARGILGTQRLIKNSKISVIRAADVASLNTAYMDTTLATSAGGGIIKVADVSQLHDVSATPIVYIRGDVTGAGAVAPGDYFIEADSRTGNAGGGSSASVVRRVPNGLFADIDDGTRSGTLYGQSRTTYPILKSKVNYSNTSRPLTHDMVQVLVDQLARYNGDDMADEEQYFLLSERGVRTKYVAAEGEAAKRYAQEDKAKKLLSGFKDVGLAFLGNDAIVPWVVSRDCPYGHALFMRKKDLRVMWDQKPHLVDQDGLTLRQIPGRPRWYIAMEAYGNFRKEEPWMDCALSGLESKFS